MHNKSKALAFSLCVVLCLSFFYFSFAEANEPVQRLEPTSTKTETLKALKTVLSGQWREDTSSKFITPVFCSTYTIQESNPVASLYLDKSKAFVSFSLQIIEYIQKMDGKKKKVSLFL